MANLAMDDIIRATVICTNPLKNQTARNQFYYQVTAITGTWSPGQCASSMGSAHALVYKPWMSPNSEYTQTDCRRVTPNPTPDTTSQFMRGVGTAGTTPLPTQVTGLILCEEDAFHVGSKTPKHPDGTLQSSSGRAYIPFPSRVFLSENSSGSMTDAGLQVLQTIAALVYSPRTLINTGASITLTPVIRNVIYDRTVDPVTSQVFWRPVFNRSASQLWATQKSRGDRGQHEVLSL